MKNDNLETVLDIINSFSLEYYFKLFITKNKAHLHPYHNFYHTCKKIESTIEIAESENLNYEMKRLLVIADLYHDRDHSGGLHSDEFNVKNSISLFNSESVETGVCHNNILDFINCTQYPYNKEPINIYEKIMRDSDMSSLITDNFFQTNAIGLAKELDITPFHFLNNQIAFMENIVNKGFYTNYANENYIEQVKKNIVSIKRVQFLINN